jgi:hypothetical protein
MTDQERILKLLEEGKISREQAEGLLEALDEVDNSELTLLDQEANGSQQLAEITRRVAGRITSKTKELDSKSYRLDRGPNGELIGLHMALGNVSDEVRANILGNPEIPQLPTLPVPPIPPTFPFTQTDDLPNDLRWIRVNVLSGDVDIAVNPKVKTLQVEAEEGADVQQDEDGNWTVTLKNDDLNLEIPEGFGVMLEVKSGDVNAHVPVVRGSVMSGDVSLEDVESLNLVVMSGDVRATLKLKKGKHDLRVSSGDVFLEFQEDASVSYQSSVYSGDVYISYPEGDFNSENTSFEGKIGEGAAQFSLEVQSGVVNIEIEGEGSSVASKGKTTGKASKSAKSFNFNFDFDFSKKSVKEPPNLRWLAVRCLSGDVSLRTEAGLTQPKIIEGGQAQKKENGDLRIFCIAGDVEVVLPEDYGVRLDVLAGDLTATGVAYVKGRVWAGDARLEEVRGVNLLVMAGEAQAGLLLTENEHSLEVWSGDANVEILPGSSVKTKGSILAGDKRVETHDPNAYKSIDNRNFEVITKGGTAQLNISLKAGDLSLETHDD